VVLVVADLFDEDYSCRNSSGFSPDSLEAFVRKTMACQFQWTKVVLLSEMTNYFSGIIIFLSLYLIKIGLFGLEKILRFYFVLSCATYIFAA
jgi:hypothetical protein